MNKRIICDTNQIISEHNMELLKQAAGDIVEHAEELLAVAAEKQRPGIRKLLLKGFTC